MKRTIPGCLLTFWGILTFCLMFGGPSTALAFSVEGGLTRWHQLQPGGNYSGVISLRNDGDSTEEVRIYQTHFSYQADGQLDFENAPKTSRSNREWITVSPEQVKIPPQSQIQISYRVTIPNRPGLGGSYWSMVMVESIPEGVLEPVQTEDQSVTFMIQPVFRYGVQVITDIGNQATGAIDFQNSSLVRSPNGYELIMEVAGKGEKVLEPQLWVEIFHPENGSLGRFLGEAFLLHPGCSTTGKIPLPNLEKGTYQALIVADNGGDEVFGMQVDLVMP